MDIKGFIFDWGNTLMMDFPEFPGKMKDWPKVEAVSYAKEVLEELSKEKIVILATNAENSDEDDIKAALEKGGLKDFIHGIFCYRNQGIKKSDPDFFSAILKKLNLDPKDLIMVGDSFENDINPANMAGIFGLWYNPFSDEVKKNHLYDTIHSLKELRKYINKG